MQRTGLYLTVIVGVLTGATVAETKQERKDAPPLLVQLNVMQQEHFPLERLIIEEGDWVELFAALPTIPGEQIRTFKIESEVQGAAVERLATVRPAMLVLAPRHGPGPASDRTGYDHKPSPKNEEPLIFLRGKSVGKATIKITVPRGGNWKETREFEIMVTNKGEETQGQPVPQ